MVGPLLGPLGDALAGRATLHAIEPRPAIAAATGIGTFGHLAHDPGAPARTDGFGHVI